MPGRVDRLWTVVGVLSGDAFAPRGHPITVDELEERDTAFVDDAARDPERLAQWETDLTQRDSFDPEHSALFLRRQLVAGDLISGPLAKADDFVLPAQVGQE